MVEAEALKKFINIPKYQEIVSVTPTRSRKRHEVLVEFNNSEKTGDLFNTSTK